MFTIRHLIFRNASVMGAQDFDVNRYARTGTEEELSAGKIQNSFKSEKTTNIAQIFGKLFRAGSTHTETDCDLTKCLSLQTGRLLVSP